MAYDEDLADRVRGALAPLTVFTELKMFGGLAFMVNTHMACGVMGEDLMVRVGADGYEAALARGARQMDFTGRPMKGFVVVPGTTAADDEALAQWVAEAVDFARSQPPKKGPGARPGAGAGTA